MTDNEKFAVAAHLYVLLRRKVGRAIDTVWMVQNAEYAREVLRIAREQADTDLNKLVTRFEALSASGGQPPTPEPPPVAGKYVGSLR